MYTVLTADGQPKINRFGLVVFTRTLKQARAQCDPGEAIIGWSSSGGIRSHRRRSADGVLRLVR